MKKIFCALLVAPLIVLSSYAVEQKKPLPKMPMQVTVRNRENQKITRTLEDKVWHKIPVFRDNYYSNNNLAIDLSDRSSATSLDVQELEVIQDYLENEFSYKDSTTQQIDQLYIDQLHATVRKLGLYEYIKKDTHRVTKVVPHGNHVPVSQKKKETIVSNPSLFVKMFESSLSPYIVFLFSCAVHVTAYSGALFGEF